MTRAIKCGDGLTRHCFGWGTEPKSKKSRMFGTAAELTSSYSNLRWFLCAGSLFILSAGILPAAPLRVIDESAIPFTAFLSKADFDQRYPGERIEDPTKLDKGWYVIYEHEALNYYFGPILLESMGQDYYDQLAQTVEAAAAQRPSIRGYRLELSYQPSEPTSSFASSEPSPEPSAAKPASPQTGPKPTLWAWVKRILGFR